MRVTSILFVTLLLDVPAAISQEDRPPPNEPPQLWRASASEKDGKVAIQLAQPEYVAPRKAVPAEPMKWRALKPVTLGATVRAFGPDGKRVESKAVLKALAKPKCVAVFVRFYGPLLDPDPVYLGMFREGTIVLVVDAGDIADPIP